METKIKVLIVEDHPFMRKGMRVYISAEEDLEVVGEAPNGAAALELALRLSPDVILMDLVLPDMNGIEVIQQISGYDPAPKILVLSNYSDDNSVIASLQAGAMGYMFKTDPPQMVVQAIRDATSGRSTMTSRANYSVMQYMLRKPAVKHPEELLTRREYEILKLMAVGMTNQEISEKCVISETTVRSHINNMVTKLGLENRVQLVIYAVREGVVTLN